MIGARTQMQTIRPFNPDTVFDISFEEYEIRDGYCQIQFRFTLLPGQASFTVDWGDGTVEQVSGYEAWHNYRSVGTFRVRLGPQLKWWRLWECYTVTGDGRPLVSRPRIRPICWSDTLESCSGTYCGWSQSDHGGVVGRVIPWGRSITSTFCCYQFCSDITGPFPAWTDTITDATGTFDRCRGLSGRIPRWGRNITKVAQCYCDCTGAVGCFPPWPARCTQFSSCYEGATGLHGIIPPWPSCGEELDSVFKGCIGAVGDIPPWPASMTWVNSCYKDCPNLTGAWTDDPAELMPEERVRASPDSNYYRCYDVVTGCSDSLRALFWDVNWGGTIPRPTPLPKWP